MVTGYKLVAIFILKIIFMKQKIQLQIPEPCHENWNSMTPTQQGRFCLSCQKEVIDFSVMTDKEILQYISTASEKTCGRIGSQQLNRDLIAPPEPRKIWWKYWMSVAASLVILSAKSNAQVKAPKAAIVAMPLVGDTNYIEIVAGGISAIRNEYQKKEYLVTGVVKDDKDSPIPGATIMIKGTKKGTASDRDGKFSIIVTGRENTSLLVSCIGFETQNARVENHSNQISVIENIKLNPLVMGFMGDIVITKRKKKSLFNYFKADNVKPEIIQVKQIQPALAIYPNPVIKGTDIKMSIDHLKEGNYRLSVCDIMGNPVVAKEIKITASSVKESLQCDQRFAGGVYIFSLTGNGINISSKCVVQ